MANITDEDFEIAKVAYKQGIIWGRELKKAYEEGLLDLNKSIELVLPIGNMNVSNFSLMTRMTMEFGSSRFAVGGNSFIAGAGIVTGVSSGLQYGRTTNKAAKVCYGLSCVLSGSAVASSGTAALSRACQISEVGALSEACAVAFLIAGNKAHVQALQFEGKPVPPHLQRYMRPGVRPAAFNNNGAAFIMPGNCHLSSEIIGKIPFYKIGKFIGVGISVYAYSKFVIIAYRYSQRLITTFKKRRNSRLLKECNSRRVRNLALFVICSSYYGRGKISRLIRVYNFALSS